MAPKWLYTRSPAAVSATTRSSIRQETSMTEAFGGRVMRVAADSMLTENPAEDFVADAALGPQPGGHGFGADGITVDSQDRLYVATVDTGGIYRIATAPRPDRSVTV